MPPRHDFISLAASLDDICPLIFTEITHTVVFLYYDMKYFLAYAAGHIFDIPRH